MKTLLRSIMLVVAFGGFAETAAVTRAVAETATHPGASLRWEWSGSGHFPRTFSLTLMHSPEGTSFALLEEWGQLKSVDGWGELQRSHKMTFGSVRKIGDRNFIVLAGVPRAAEFTIAADGVLHLTWFARTTPEPTEADLLSDRASGTASDLPEEMRPSWAPYPKPAGPPPI
jgi:hypothetical protein